MGGDSQLGRFVITPIGRRLLVAWFARYDVLVAQRRVERDRYLEENLRAEADLCPEDEQVHEDDQYLDDDQIEILRLVVWTLRHGILLVPYAKFVGFDHVECILDDLVKSRVIELVPSG